MKFNHLKYFKVTDQKKKYFKVQTQFLMDK